MNSLLPPLGAIGEYDHASCTSYLGGLAQESSFARAEWLVMADENLEIYTYGSLNYDSEKIQVNEIQNAIIAATDLQTRQPPAVTLEPVETGEPPQSFWAGPPQVLAQLGVMSQPGQPLDPMLADQLRQMGANGAIKPEWLVDVDDRLIAQTYQTIFDVYWQRSAADRFIRSNLLTTNIQGWTFALYEFDDDEQRHLLRMQSVRQVYIDPTVEDVADAAYVGLDMVLDAEQAKSMYPQLADQIDASAERGLPPRPDSTTDWGQAFDRDFQRPMVVMRVFWLRDQPIPLSADEAIQGGRVQEVPNEIAQIPGVAGAVDPLANGSAQSALGSSISPMGGATEPEVGNAQVQLNGDAVPLAEDAGAGDGGAEPDVGGVASPDVGDPSAGLGGAVSYRLPTGASIAPGDPAWPTRRGIRQITVIADTVVDDRECEHWDIPILHNVNLPLPGRPWGLGEPFRLQSLQQARSRMLDALVTHCEFFKAPASTMSQSMWDALPAEFRNGAHIKPNMVLVVPDDLYALTGGKVMTIVDPPQTPPALVQMQGILKEEISEQSGHTDVLQGIAPSSGMSGKALATLQQGATSLIGFKARRTEDVVRRLANLMLHSLVWRLDAPEVGRIISQYPIDVLQAIMTRARQIEWDVKVEITSGSGEMQAQNKQQAMQERQLGIISMQTTRERMGEDNQQEESRMEAEARKQMAMMPQPQLPAKASENPPIPSH